MLKSNGLRIYSSKIKYIENVIGKRNERKNERRCRIRCRSVDRKIKQIISITDSTNYMQFA